MGTRWIKGASLLMLSTSEHFFFPREHRNFCELWVPKIHHLKAHEAWLTGSLFRWEDSDTDKTWEFVGWTSKDIGDIGHQRRPLRSQIVGSIGWKLHDTIHLEPRKAITYALSPDTIPTEKASKLLGFCWSKVVCSYSALEANFAGPLW